MLGKQKPSYRSEKELEDILVLFGQPTPDRKDEFFAFYAYLATLLSMISKCSLLPNFIAVNGGLRSNDNKRLKFEENLAPELIVPELVKLCKNDIGEACPTGVFEAVSRVMMRFTLLDIHADFYPNEGRNPYFASQCKHFSDYASKLVEFSEALTEDYFAGHISSETVIDTTKPKGSHLFSQKSLNSYLWFLFLIVRLKTRPM